VNNYSLVEPFETDNLPGTDAELAFALGVEWEMFRQRLNTEGRFTQFVTAEGVERIAQMAERHGRFVEHHPLMVGWSEIVVGDYKDS